MRRRIEGCRSGNRLQSRPKDIFCSQRFGPGSQAIHLPSANPGDVPFPPMSVAMQARRAKVSACPPEKQWKDRSIRRGYETVQEAEGKTVTRLVCLGGENRCVNGVATSQDGQSRSARDKNESHDNTPSADADHYQQYRPLFHRQRSTCVRRDEAAVRAGESCIPVRITQQQHLNLRDHHPV